MKSSTRQITLLLWYPYGEAIIEANVIRYK